MINLLPAEIKSNIKAARANSTVIRYIIILAVSGILLGLGCLVVYNINQAALDTATKALKPTTGSSAGSSSSQLATANEYRNKLQEVQTSVVPNQINYSKILTTIGSAIPSGVIIDTLDLSATSFSSTIKIQTYANSDSSAGKIKTSLENASTVFTSVVINNQSILPTPMYEKYSISVELTVSLNKGLK